MRQTPCMLSTCRQTVVGIGMLGFVGLIISAHFAKDVDAILSISSRDGRDKLIKYVACILDFKRDGGALGADNTARPGLLLDKQRTTPG